MTESLQLTAQVPIEGMGEALHHEWMKDKDLRSPIEQEWLADLMQYMGRYDSSVKIPKGDSRIFVKRTRVKVRTLDAKLGEIILPVNKKLWDIVPSPKPEIPQDRRQWIMSKLAEAAFSSGQPPAELITPENIEKMELAFAKAAAQEMSREVADILAESQFQRVARRVLHSGHLYGLGVMKGPMVESRIIRSWEGSPEFGFQVVKREKLAPVVHHIKVWDFYPDITARDLYSADRYSETHWMSKAEFYALASRPDFIGPAIIKHCKDHPEGDAEWERYHSDLQGISRIDASEQSGKPLRQYVAVERWGVFDGGDLRRWGLDDLPEDFHGLVEGVVWFMASDGRVIKAQLNPFDMEDKPYNFYMPYEEETHPLGSSIPFDMRDTQQLFNAVTRSMMDNAAYATKPRWLMALHQILKQSHSNDVGPGKIFFTQQSFGDNTPPLQAIETQFLGPAYLQLLARVKELDDEAVALPSFQHGEKSAGVGRTAGGLEMLQASANMMLKEPLRSWDECFENYLGKQVNWLMQFSQNPRIKGDFQVQVRGTYSVIAREAKAEKALDFADRVASNPLFAPDINARELLIEIAEAAEMNPRVIKTEEQKAAELAATQPQIPGVPNDSGGNPSGPPGRTGDSRNATAISGEPDSQGSAEAPEAQAPDDPGANVPQY